MPARKPTQLKKTQGTYQLCRSHADEPIAPSGFPVPPEELDTIGKEYWHSICEKLQCMNILSSVDHPMLELLCKAYSQFRRAESILNKEGLTYTTISRDGQKKIYRRPEQLIYKDVMHQINVILGKFGLSPADRSRISVSTTPKEYNKLDEFLARRNNVTQ